MSNYSVKPERQHKSRVASRPHWDVHVKDSTTVEMANLHTRHTPTLWKHSKQPPLTVQGMQNTQQYRAGHTEHTAILSNTVQGVQNTQQYCAGRTEHSAIPCRAYRTLSNTVQGMQNTQQYCAGHTEHSAITVYGMQNTQQYHTGHTEHSAITVQGIQNTQQYHAGYTEHSAIPCRACRTLSNTMQGMQNTHPFSTKDHKQTLH